MQSITHIDYREVAKAMETVNKTASPFVTHLTHLTRLMFAMMFFGAVTFSQVNMAAADDNGPAVASSPLPETPSESVVESPDSAPASTSTADATTTDGASYDADAAALANEMRHLQQRISELESKSKTDSEQIEELSSRLDQQELSTIQNATDAQMDLNVYGFMDVQFSKLFIKEGTFYKGYLPDSSTFTLGHWNLFVKKSLTEHFSMLGEVRFLFQPLGEESDWVGFERAEFSRFDTRATDVVNNHFFNWGGISIQRAYVDYALSDLFGVRVGYFLTPFGIWNEEHASTVILFAHRPFLSTSGNLPEAQLGLYLFGKVFASDRVAFHYGCTVSNGRGPTSEVYDLDENKALGLTLKAIYEGAVSFNAGTYLYMGDYTDTVRSMTLPQIGFIETATVAYAEKAMSVHLKLEWKGLLLQGEYVRRLIEYQNGLRESADHGRGILFTPDHVRNGSYELLAYTLPFDRVTLTPYVLHEYKDMPSWVEYWAGHSYGVGINWTTNPFVVLKVEGLLNDHRKESGVNSDFKMFITQLAVSY
ncbi:MAG: hypothetical protein JXX14_03535 [Deltaproteobacteria bacterium]|nr:hypothetical protein [Deltaproteobacteria bacterium]